VSRTFLLAGLCGLLISWNWLRLESGVTESQGTLIVLLAIAPALVSGLRKRLAVGLGSFLLAGGIAFQLGPGVDYPGDLASRFWQGFLEFYDVTLPFDPGLHPWMRGTVLLAVFLFTLTCAIAVAGREPQPAAVALLFGAGWPATLLGGDELLRGAVLLAGLLVVLACAGPRARNLQYAPAAIAVIVVAAVAASTSPALAKHGFLSWQNWDFYTRPAKPVDVSYVWNSSYKGFSFPKKQTVVLKVKTSSRSHYWRVVPLDEVVNGRWEVGGRVDQLSNGLLGETELVAAREQDRASWLKQKVTIEALRDKFLPAADSPTLFEAPDLHDVFYDPVGFALYDKGLQRGDSYTVWSYEPQPTAAQLARSKADYPERISARREYLEVENNIFVPQFGVSNRAEQMNAYFRDYPIGAYRKLYDKAVQVAGGAHSPYAATVALESWFRTGGGFVYDQHPPQPPAGEPALVDFVTRTQRGYCQHFAGAMALMLRYLGIPARVAAGFNSGSFDKSSGEWVVTDHDAHEWVEVWFRGWGWVPFDPTPGRGGLAGAYSSSSKSFDAAAAALVLAGKNGIKQFAKTRDQLGFPSGDGNRLNADVPRKGRPLRIPSSHGFGTPGLVQLLLLVLAGIVVAIGSVKLLVRRAPYLTRDPRRLAAACHREVRAILLDQGIAVPASLTPAELAALAELKLDVSVPVFAPHATAARFGPPVAAREAARELRKAMRALRRGVRTELTGVERARGLVSLRSLGLA
jgi:transglutaminase-like putative cysteine protease